MKKLSTVFVFVLFFAINGFSQDKGYVSLNGGVGLPLGAFKATEVNDSNNGFAKLGSNFNLTAGYKFHEYVGVCAMLTFNSNARDLDKVLDEARAQSPTFTWSVDAKNWIGMGYYAGLYGTFPVTDELSLELRALSGLLTLTSPEFTAKGTDGTSTATSKQSSASSTNFSYGFGFGVKYNINETFSVLLNGNYLGSKAVFKDIPITDEFKITPTSAPNVQLSTAGYTHVYSVFNLSLGVGYNF